MIRKFKVILTTVIFLIIVLVLLLPSDSHAGSIKNNLVHYWSFDINVNDQVGLWHLGGNFSRASSGGKIGGVAEFYGSQYAEVTATNQIDTEWTISMWVNPGGTGDYALYEERSIDAGTDFNINDPGRNVPLHADIAGAPGWLTTTATYGTGTLPAGSWYMITVIANATSWKLYVNTSYASGTWSSNSPILCHASRLITFARSARYGTAYFSGKMDEVGIWNYAFSHNDVVALYNNGSGMNPTDSSRCVPPLPSTPATNLTATTCYTCDGGTPVTMDGILSVDPASGGLLEIKNGTELTVQEINVTSSGEAVHVYSGKVYVQ